MKPVFELFANLLEKRFLDGVFTTEDSVRYTLFASMLRNGISPEEIILEYPHPVIRRAEIDTWLPSYSGRAAAIEIKYNRDIPSGGNQPRTMKAGKVFNDLRRLVRVGEKSDAICYFVYVTSREMADYFSNPVNGHQEFFNLLPDRTMKIGKEYFQPKPKTFIGSSGGMFEAGLKCVLSRSLRSGHEVRVYDVRRPSNSEREQLSFDAIWSRIEELQGETFHQIDGKAFSYEIAGDVVVLSTTKQGMLRRHLEKASKFLPLNNTFWVRHLKGPDYIYAILMDSRIRQGDW